MYLNHNSMSEQLVVAKTAQRPVVRSVCILYESYDSKSHRQTVLCSPSESIHMSVISQLHIVAPLCHLPVNILSVVQKWKSVDRSFKRTFIYCFSITAEHSTRKMEPVFKREFWWYYIFSTNPMKRLKKTNKKLILLKYRLCSKSLIYCIDLSHRPPLLNTLSKM